MSYERLTEGCSTPKEREEHEKIWGGYNDPLPNMQEITVEEFARSGFFTWCITGMEFRQIHPARINQSKFLTPVKCFLSVKIFYTNGSGEDGFAMSADYWEKKVRYFKFARCYHKYNELSVQEAQQKGHTHFGYCYHVCECVNCGHVWSYDSSG